MNVIALALEKRAENSRESGLESSNKHLSLSEQIRRDKYLRERREDAGSRALGTVGGAGAGALLGKKLGVGAALVGGVLGAFAGREGSSYIQKKRETASSPQQEA